MTVNGLPKTWERLSLGGLCDRIGVGLAMGITQHYSDSGTMLLRNQNIRPDRFDASEILFLSDSFSSTQANKKLRPNDVITVRTGANIGDTCVVPAEYAGSLTFTTLIASPKRDVLCSEYLSFYINSQFGRSEVNRLMAGGGKGNLNSGELQKFQLLVPPYSEQVKIAAFLSTWDQAIQLTEKLIVAKQKRKQALMEQLLTGKVRFAEFTGNWAAIKMGDIFKRRSESGTPDLPTLSVTMDRGLIRRDSINRKMETTLEAEEHLLVRKGDLAYNMMRMWQGASGLALEDGLISPAYIVLKPTAKVDSLFASYFFKFRPTIKLFEDYSFGITGDRLRLYFKDFAAIPTRIPPVLEQQKIAAVLSTLDGEIGIHKSKLVCLQIQKKGLMQQLLTGKVRVTTGTEK